jgi:hypothetical protein
MQRSTAQRHVGCTGCGNRARGGLVYVAVPAQRQRTSAGFVVVRRAADLGRLAVREGLPVVALPTAVVAAAVRMDDRRAVRALVAEAVQRRRVTLAQLRAAAAHVSRRGSGHLRQVLDEVTAGIRSVPEADVRSLVARSAVLRGALFNCRLYNADGMLLAEPDAFWSAAGLIHETDSAEWHLGPESWDRTLRRHARLTALGLLVVHSTPGRIRNDGAALVRELESAYRAGLQRGGCLDGIRIVPA